ncbi:uncharacterized protein LOC134261573 [Saccostrea cucullata]|uniref:uncharacterized protein LOC134261573 n=1 Tax=Saccostrea cuccullata TaxID=36930 RepID=UPI002ED41C4B
MSNAYGQESSTSSTYGDGDDADDDDVDDVTTNSANDQPWYPFSSKLQMYLYILVHSKTHTISDETAKFIWFIMKECGIEMPSFSLVKNFQISGDMTPESMLSREESSDGNPFWIIKPTALLSMALSHPDTASSLLRYGRVSSDGQALLKEQSDGSKWVHEFRSHYAPNGSCTFFSGKTYSWYIIDLHYILLLVCLETYAKWNISLLSKVQRVHEYRFFKYVNERMIPVADDEKKSIIEHNQHQVRGLPVYTLPLNLFMDDTSANKSKKWKPLHCLQLQLAGIPKSRKQNPDTIKFVGASTEVPILEMAHPVIDDIRNSESGVLTFDGQRREKVNIIPCLAVCVCDFNMLAEASNHMGANTNKFCPRCYADKDSCIWKGNDRYPEETQRILNILSVNNNKDMRQNHGLKPYANPLWNILNPHSDIPVGILHWLYLGIGKHLLKSCIQDLPEVKQVQLCMMIESSDQSALTTKVSSDTIKYLDSRQGKDIKTYVSILKL